MLRVFNFFSLFIFLNSFLIHSQIISQNNYPKKFETDSNIFYISVGNSNTKIDIGNYTKRNFSDFGFINTNPSCEFFIVETNIRNQLKGVYYLFDLSGKLIIQDFFETVNQRFQIEPHLRNGIYILNILFNEGIYQTKIFVSC
jgi:hypothetical protein